MGVLVEIAGRRYEAIDYSISEQSSPVSPDDTMGSTGSIQFTIPRPDPDLGVERADTEEVFRNMWPRPLPDALNLTTVRVPAGGAISFTDPPSVGTPSGRSTVARATFSPTVVSEGSSSAAFELDPEVFVPLIPGRTYRISLTFRTSASTLGDTHFRWRAQAVPVDGSPLFPEDISDGAQQYTRYPRATGWTTYSFLFDARDWPSRLKFLLEWEIRAGAPSSSWIEIDSFSVVEETAWVRDNAEFRTATGSSPDFTSSGVTYSFDWAGVRNNSQTVGYATKPASTIVNFPVIAGLKQWVGKPVRIVDSYRGAIIGYVEGVQEGEGGHTIQVSCRTQLGELNVENLVVPGFSGRLEDAVHLYLSYSGRELDLWIEGEIADRQVTLGGWKGELWNHLKMLAMAQGCEVALVGSVIVFRPIRERSLSSIPYETRDLSLTDSASAQQVTVVWYEYETWWARWDDRFEPNAVRASEWFTAPAGETSDFDVPTNGTPTRVNFPDATNIRDVAYTHFANPEGSELGPYDETPWYITSLEFVKANGRTFNYMDYEEGGFRVSITAPLEYTLIGNLAGDFVSSWTVRSLIGGSGILYTQRHEVTVSTGDETSGTPQVTVIDNPFITTADDAYTLAKRMASRFSGSQFELSGSMLTTLAPGEAGTTAQMTYAEVYDEIQEIVEGTGTTNNWDTDFSDGNPLTSTTGSGTWTLEEGGGGILFSTDFEDGVNPFDAVATGTRVFAVEEQAFAHSGTHVLSTGSTATAHGAVYYSAETFAREETFESWIRLGTSGSLSLGGLSIVNADDPTQYWSLVMDPRNTTAGTNSSGLHIRYLTGSSAGGVQLATAPQYDTWYRMEGWLDAAGTPFARLYDAVGNLLGETTWDTVNKFTNAHFGVYGYGDVYYDDFSVGEEAAVEVGFGEGGFGLTPFGGGDPVFNNYLTHTGAGGTAWDPTFSADPESLFSGRVRIDAGTTPLAGITIVNSASQYATFLIDARNGTGSSAGFQLRSETSLTGVVGVVPTAPIESGKWYRITAIIQDGQARGILYDENNVLIAQTERAESRTFTNLHPGVYGFSDTSYDDLSVVTTTGEGISYGDVQNFYGTIPEGDTFRSVQRYWQSMKSSAESRQDWGNAAGTRLWHKGIRRWFRIRSSDFTPGQPFRFQADDDLLMADVLPAFAGKTYAEVDDLYPIYTTYEGVRLAGVPNG